MSTDLVGVFTDEGEARDIAERLNRERDTDSNHFQVLPMPPLNEVAEEYRDDRDDGRES